MYSTENYQIILPLLENSLKRALHLIGTFKLPPFLTMVFFSHFYNVFKNRQCINSPEEIKTEAVITSSYGGGLKLAKFSRHLHNVAGNINDFDT